ncbi:MAG TPA: hypothetical protein VL068_13390 [Microthrixaceae bacterium]|nr:hypothetical protein [Microthrixaceae bacterium]
MSALIGRVEMVASRRAQGGPKAGDSTFPGAGGCRAFAAAARVAHAARFMDGRRARAVERGADQGGFALIAVLAVIAMTAVMIGALMGLLMLTMKITSNTERVERERRASDGAIVATLNHLRLNAGGMSACATVPNVEPGFIVPFERVGTSGEVSVTCGPAADDYSEPGGEVKLLGTDYAGAITDWKTAWPWAAAPNGAGSAIGVSGFSPTLIHSGPEPLRFNGHVNSAAGAAALRDPITGSPAIDIKGEYRQGPAGLGASGTDCGILDIAGAPTFIQTMSGMTCGDPSALATAAPADYGVDASLPSLPPEVSGGCPAGPVVTLPSGRYQHNDVKKLNSWFDGHCSGRTFHFPTGIYYFDANDPTVPAADRNALIINDASSSFVFGEAKGWSLATGATAVNFPSACNAGVSASQPGASIVLSGRTSLQHRAGRLAICPFVSDTGTAFPTILQQDTVPTYVKVSPGSDGDFQPFGNLISNDVDVATVPVAMRCPSFTYPNCSSDRTFEVNLATNSSAEALDSVKIRLTGREVNYPNNTVNGRWVKFDVTLASGATPSCTTDFLKGGMDLGHREDFELLSGTCKTKITNGSQLDGAKIKATVRYRYATLCAGCGLNPQTLSLWNVQVVIDPVVNSASSVATSSKWNDIANVLDEDPSTASLQLPCGLFQIFCGARPEMSVVGSFTLDGVKLSGKLGADDSLDSIGVSITQVSITGNTADKLRSRLDGETELTIETSDGAKCTRTWGSVLNIEGTTYYPMLDKDSSTCGGVSWSPEALVGSLLQGAKLTAKFTLNCLDPAGGSCGSVLSYIRPIPISHVGIVATTNSYKGPVTKSRLTINSAATGPGSSANFFGSAYLPHSALDIFWNGRNSGASIIGGELQLWSLGSRMAAGSSSDVVCCTKPEIEDRKIRVTAHIDGRPVLSVVAKMAATGGAPEILEWTQCGRNGTCT